ncbi:MAG: hypothetical protein CJD30_09280 [Sulfuricurvum sp. PD_MW2]|jgi:hypothetical protein|uniref:hypothetical protein n=1 Tax=Sulfuricurvum sp. PD_MW2 TaxID=2027917 RepID=UPI000C066CB9|nr:hypothetical protein [Sulfuricurvum sp. PD_MW2]PHM16872.1 MAG: hypothetical protein CJD30_09280 [Sulfuricurvum sp. PD_MW2]
MKKSLLFLLVFITSITLYASDVILSNTLGAYYCAQEPNPKTYIKHTVEDPISIYWEDNVYPGFDDKDAELMVKNYLDGVHLQTMALNTRDGKVKMYFYVNIPQSYVALVKEGYTVTKEAQKKHAIFEDAWKKYKAKEWTKAEFDVVAKDSGEANKIKESLTKQIETEKVKLDLVITETTRDQMPQMNYTVKTEEVHLSDLASKVLYSDEVKVTDNRTKEVIAYNRRIMQLYSASLIPDVAMGGRRFYPHPLCGKSGIEIFDEDVFTAMGRVGVTIFPFKHTKLYW